MTIDDVTSTADVDFNRRLALLLSVFVQGERAMIRHRVRNGQHCAMVRGKGIGRPRRAVDEQLIVSLRSEGKSLREIARAVERSTNVVQRVLKEAK